MEDLFSYFINVISTICISLKTFLDNNSTQLIGIIGASAWFAPWVYQKISRPSIKGQLISIHQNGGKFRGRECIMHFMALNVISLNKESNINMIKTQISVKYQDDKEVYRCKQFWARYSEWVNAEGEHFELRIYPEQALLYTNSLPKDTAKKVYVIFKDESGSIAREIEEISITLFDYSNNKNKLIFTQDDMDVEKMVWDDRIWVPKKPEMVMKYSFK